MTSYYVHALPRTRRRRQWPSDRLAFLICYLIFALDQMTWAVFSVFAKGEWFLVIFVPFWAFMYRFQIVLYERAKRYEERYNMPYPPISRWLWLALMIMYALSIWEWTWPL